MWLESNASNNGGALWLIECMKSGGLAGCRIADREATLYGFVRTFEDLIAIGRRWAVRNGLAKKRSFERTRDGDRFGYGFDSDYPAWDHPGNNSGY